MEENPMFSKPKSWLSGGLWKPKNPHSLEHLRYLHGVVCKNPTVTEQNRALLVETLRSISEILIWGDQNDSSVFDFFLEKNMLGFFLRFMKQKYGRFICVQLLQTLNILFENISNETSVYYLLSNNHINSIIVHKFDFSDEEVMAYYISFLKTLSLKLNKHTIHFFYNEHTNDFALYTEAIKFFNHSESMVRIAVRTITLNVYKVEDKSMLRFIRDKTAAPYFSNLVWFIGNHVLELDSCVRHDIDHNSRDRLADLVAEHLDHLHYLNDILCLEIHALNEVLTDHLLNRLLIPLYVHSLTQTAAHKYSAAVGAKQPAEGERPHVQCVVSLFLLSQVFLIMHHAPLVRQLARLIFHAQRSVFSLSGEEEGEEEESTRTRMQAQRCIREFVKPAESLAKTLDSARGGGKPMKRPNFSEQDNKEGEGDDDGEGTSSDRASTPEDEQNKGAEASAAGSSDTLLSPVLNSTDDEKLMTAAEKEAGAAEFTLDNKPYLAVVFQALECEDDDYEALFTLCLLYAIGHNNGINQELLDSVFFTSGKAANKEHYNVALIEKLINIIRLSCQNNSRVRLATLELCIKLLKTLVYSAPTSVASPGQAEGASGATGGKCYLQDRHLAAIEGAREEATLLLRNFYKVWEKSEEIFLDMFEDEFREMKNRPLNVEYLTMDASILLPPTGTPLTGIDFNKRLPCGEVERARRAIRVFFYLRDLSLSLQDEDDTQLPLTRSEECVKLGDVLDLNNSDLIACTVISKDNKRERRFLVIDVLQLILVEPDSRRLGWGKVRFVGFLQDVEVAGDKEDSRSLHITIHKPSLHNAHARPLPLLSARFTFDDHIRCMAARQRLAKGRLRARQRKMQMIARLLQLPAALVDAMYQPAPAAFTTAAVTLRANRSRAGSSAGSSSSHPGRAQSSDMLKQSVFAGVESSAPFDAARAQELAAKEPRHLPRQNSRSKGGGGGASGSKTGGSVIKPAASGVLSPEQQARLKKKAEKVAKTKRAAREQSKAKAEPPTTPEAKAFQSLNQLSQKAKDEGKGTGGKLSRNSSSSSLTKEIEIPLEDLSPKPGGSLRRIQLDGSSKSRSSSYSPSRRISARRLSSDSLVAGGASRVTSRSPLSSVEKGVIAAEKRERSGSCPSPRHLSRSNSASSASGSGAVDVTSFITRGSGGGERRRASANRVVIGTTTNTGTEDDAASTSTAAAAGGETKTRSDSAPSAPPSLTPAAAAPLSLVTCDLSASVPALGSPILLAPTDIKTNPDLDNETDSAKATPDTVFFPKPPAKTTAGVELSTASPEKDASDPDSKVSAKEELTRIAKIPSDSGIQQMDEGSLELSPVTSNTTG